MDEWMNGRCSGGEEGAKELKEYTKKGVLSLMSVAINI